MSRSHDTNQLPPETHLGRSALCVADIEPVTDFYRDVVGLSTLRSESDATVLGVEGRPLLVLEETTATYPRPPDATGLYHNAFRVPTRAVLGDALGRLREHGSLTGASDHGVSEAIYASDPAGNGVEIYRDYPREEWPTTDGGRVAMTTDPIDRDGVLSAAEGASQLPPETDLGHVHLEVSSLAAFRACYVDAMGFVTRAEVSGAAFVAAGGYHHHVGANVWQQRREPATGPGLGWFEIVVPDADVLAGARNRLDSEGYDVTERATGFAVTDADGIQVRLRTAE